MGNCMRLLPRRRSQESKYFPVLISFKIVVLLSLKVIHIIHISRDLALQYDNLALLTLG